MKATFTPIEEIDAVDLTRHALVEASAGTGKTYTIENLVVRLLKETPDLKLENILLVTFTEKATSELQQRIRQKIEQTLDCDPGLNDAVRKKLSDTLDAFDDAAIFTIHGFCHTLLKVFPFEAGGLFQQELIDDGPLLEKLLRAQMRTQWPRRHGRHLHTLLALANFTANPEAFVATAVNLAQRLGGDPAHETVIPDPAGLDAQVLWQTVHALLIELKQLVGTPPRLSTDYARLNINAKTRATIIRDMVEPLEQALDQVDAEVCELCDFMPLVATLRARHPSSGMTNIERLVPQNWIKAGENLQDCPNLTLIRDRLCELMRLFASLAHVLMLTSVSRLQAEARALKARNGWISYQDMLTRVADFLTGQGTEAGILKIRQRFRVAFVDEFQDTDDVQWRIFSTLFLHGRQDQPDNRLFLIGDPKQAIYAFRGADVFTYLSARQQMKTLAAQGRANLYDLALNWRSAPGLVDAFNCIFSREVWFGARADKGPFEIGYQAVGSPDADRLPAAIGRDRSGRPPLNVMDLTTARSHGEAKALLADFICREIRFLVGQGGIRIADRSGAERALHHGDIAILVRSQSEFYLIEPLLNEHGIPYAYYRKPGLFQCREAHWLSMVLRAVSNPQSTATVRLALLSPFFDIVPAALEARPELPADHVSQLLLARWHAHAQRRRWGALFQSLMEDSGLISRHCTDPGWDRSETNMRQLFDHLDASAYTMNLDIGGLVALLDNLRLGHSAAGSDADIHQIEDEGDKVQILTMHVSKGLEFPVVFIAGGLTARRDCGMHVYHSLDPAHPEQGCHKVIDLTCETGGPQAQKEQEDENKRLYYVALTRARSKLYVPYYPNDGKQGWVGPVSRFVSQSIGQAFPDAADGPLGSGWHAAGHHAGRMPDPRPAHDDDSQAQKRLTVEPLLPTQEDFRHRKTALESFSSIGHRIGQARGSYGQPAAFTLTDVSGRPVGRDDEPVAAGRVEGLEPAEGLPGGTQTGSMLHHIFENIDFQAVMDGPADILADEALRRVIASAGALYRIEMQWLPEVARIVAAALRTPIAADGADLTLGRLAPARRRHEMEFYFPLQAPSAATPQVPGCTVDGDPRKQMIIRGFIDLVFVWQERYYILDWKSNRLEEGYDQAAMAREMAAAGYELQYRLYTVALLRWLQRCLGRRFDAQRHFGGAYYIFLRGIGLRRGEGVHYVPAAQLLPLNTLQETIRQQIAGIQW